MSDLFLESVQSRTTTPSDYETKLAGAIEEVFATGRHDLPGLVAGLNDLNIPAPGGSVWDEDLLIRVIDQLEA